MDPIFADPCIASKAYRPTGDARAPSRRRSGVRWSGVLESSVLESSVLESSVLESAGPRSLIAPVGSPSGRPGTIRTTGGAPGAVVETAISAEDGVSISIHGPRRAAREAERFGGYPAAGRATSGVPHT